MTVSYFVRYDISTADIGAFLEHYLRRVAFSKQRAEARLDFQSLPAFSGTVTHQAMQGEEVWRKS